MNIPLHILLPELERPIRLAPHVNSWFRADDYDSRIKLLSAALERVETVINEKADNNTTI